jgi:predicted acylesterase/phospholipase RssA
MNLNKLVIGGGGIKGFSFIGILKYMEENNLLDNITHYYGSSAGAIICTLLCIDYTIDEIEELISLEFDKFVDISLEELFTNFGLCNGQKLYNLFYAIIKQKYEDVENLTFKIHFKKFNKFLSITGSKINNYEGIYFNHETYPDFLIIDALKITCCIPLFFTPIEINNELYVDGDLFCPYPIPKNDYEQDSTFFIQCSIDINDKFKSLDDYLKALFYGLWNLSKDNKLDIKYILENN